MEPIEISDNSRLNIQVDNNLVRNYFTSEKVFKKIIETVEKPAITECYNSLIVDTTRIWQKSFKTPRYANLFSRVIEPENLAHIFWTNIYTNLLSNAVEKFLYSGQGDLNNIIYDLINEDFIENVLYACYNGLEDFYNDLIQKEQGGRFDFTFDNYLN